MLLFKVLKYAVQEIWSLGFISTNQRRYKLCSCSNVQEVLPYSSVSATFISFTLTIVEVCMSRDIFAWLLRGISEKVV